MMTSTLHDQLARLADQVDPESAAVPAQDLWERGVRYRQRRRTGTAIITSVAVLVVMVVSVLSWRMSAPTSIAPADGGVGLPSQIHEPSKWLPGTGSAPPGQLVAVLHAERGTFFGSEYGSVGISATTGAYRFLDLPDQSDDREVALAPDGRHVAYWITGTTSGTRNTSSGQVDEVTTGVAVYDTMTGAVTRHQIGTEHGLWVVLLAWVDDDSLVLDVSQIVGGDDASDMDQSSAVAAPALIWNLGEEPRPFPELDDVSPQFAGASASGRLVVLGSDGHFALLDGNGDVERWSVGTTMDGQGGLAVDPSGTRVAGVSTRGGHSPNKIAIAALPETSDGSTDYRELPQSDQSFVVRGWTDENHVLVQRRVGKVKDCLCMGLYEMDVRTGASEVVIGLPDGWFNNGQWATGLLAAPVVDRPAPATPMSPRLVVALLAIAVGGGVIGVWRWRRRVTP